MISTVGISHKTAPIDVRERFAFTPEEAERIVAALPGEAMVLSTCNRTELYSTLPPSTAGHALAVAAHAPLDTELFVLRGEEAARHLFAVAAGLDSMVLGEFQILGQVKRALVMSRSVGRLGTVLSRLGQRALVVGRRVRRETALGRNLPSIPKVATEVAMERLGDLRSRSLVLIGAGKIGDLTAHALRQAGAPDVVVTNRTFEAAEQLAREIGGRAAPFADLDRLLAAADVVISCTGAPDVILDAARVGGAMEQRGGRPLLLLDIAVPRDVTPDVRGIPGVDLVDLDGLRGHAAGAVAPETIAEAEAIVDAEARAFVAWYAGRSAVPTIQALRGRAEAILEDELGHTDGDRQRLREFGERVLNKLLHHPLVRLRDGAAAQGEEYLAVARDLFALDEPSDD